MHLFLLLKPNPIPPAKEIFNLIQLWFWMCCNRTFWFLDYNGIHVHLKDVMLQCKYHPFFIGKCFLLMHICLPSQSFLLSKHGCRKNILELSINCVMVTSDKFEWSKMGEDSASLDVNFLFFGDIFSSSFSLRSIMKFNFHLKLFITYFR
mgnify:CR=1 FL=1